MGCRDGYTKGACSLISIPPIPYLPSVCIDGPEGLKGVIGMSKKGHPKMDTPKMSNLDHFWTPKNSHFGSPKPCNYLHIWGPKMDPFWDPFWDPIFTSTPLWDGPKGGP